MTRFAWLLGLSLAAGVGAAPARSWAGGDDLQVLRAGLAREVDGAQRAALMPRLAALGGRGAAETLARSVRTDMDPVARAAAARALGEIDADQALELLAGVLVEGGPRIVRDALARALARRDGGLARARKAVEDTGRREGERILWLEALFAFDDEASRSFLASQVVSPSPWVRGAAARALARREDGRAERLGALAQGLASAPDRESALQVLDAMESALEESLRPVLLQRAGGEDPFVRRSAARLVAMLDRARAAAAEMAGQAPAPPAGGADRYAPARRPEDEDLPPPRRGMPRPQFDLVYALDVTGSTSTTIEHTLRRIREEVSLLVRLGSDVRVGVVGYRGGRGVEARRQMDVLLPCFDPERIEAFLASIEPSGTDDRGAAVSVALSEALDRMAWRRQATREVRLVADSRCDDPQAATALAALHWRADETRTSVAYVLRTRPRIPAEFDDIAREGGGAPVEALREPLR